MAGRSEQMSKVQILPMPLDPNVFLFDSHWGHLRNTPPPELKQINLKPSPSPPPEVPLPATHDASPDPSSPHPSPGYAVLVSFMGDGKITNIARQAGMEKLASAAEADPVQKES